MSDAVLDDVRTWQSRPFDPVCPIVYFDCIVVNSRQDGNVGNLVLAIRKELLGLWIFQNEGAKFRVGGNIGERATSHLPQLASHPRPAPDEPSADYRDSLSG